MVDRGRKRLPKARWRAAVSVAAIALVLGGCGSSTEAARIESYRPGDGDRQIQVLMVVGSAQEEPESVEVTESDDSVTVDIAVPVQHGDNPAIAVEVEIPVELEAPWGDRAVIDGSRDVEVPRVDDPFAVAEPGHDADDE